MEQLELALFSAVLLGLFAPAQGREQDGRRAADNPAR